MPPSHVTARPGDRRSDFIRSVFIAVARARGAIAAIAATYLLSIAIGAAMVHGGSSLALGHRDALVSRARKDDPTLAALQRGNRMEAALRDFGGNLLLGAIPKTVSGLSVVMPFPLVAYQGWVGGIVAVRDDHTSRLSNPREAAYYLITLLLQVIPYALAGGAGVNLGLAFLRPRPPYDGTKWLNIPRDALWDTLRIYILIVPLFFLASLWEFLAA
jgi:hypothetical protein